MRDDELSEEEGSDDSNNQKSASESEDEEEFADETVDETRLRLAKKYLDTVKQETAAAEDEVFADIETVATYYNGFEHCIIVLWSQQNRAEFGS